MKKKRIKKPSDDSLTCEVLKFLRRDTKDGYNFFDLRIAKWSKGKGRVLEKRHTWILKDGTVRNRQLVALNLADVNFIVEHHKEIIQVLTGATDVNETAS